MELFKNMVEDTSTYIDPKTKTTVQRGSKENIAVKLYGTNYADAHPKNGDITEQEEDGIFTTWFENKGRKDRVFKVQSYTYIDGGVNPSRTGTYESKSVDLAILTLHGTTVTYYFDYDEPLSLTEDVFKRLEWVEVKSDKLKGVLKFPLLDEALENMLLSIFLAIVKYIGHLSILRIMQFIRNFSHTLNVLMSIYISV